MRKRIISMLLCLAVLFSVVLGTGLALLGNWLAHRIPDRHLLLSK